MANPKILYPALAYIDENGLGISQITLAFVYPPQAVPAYSLRREAHKNLASSGVREVIVERIENFTDLKMDWVVAGTDVAAWNSFYIGCALPGIPFDLYPDASQPGYTPYRLEGKSWKAEYGSGKKKYAGMWHFSATLRAWVAP